MIAKIQLLFGLTAFAIVGCSSDPIPWRPRRFVEFENGVAIQDTDSCVSDCVDAEYEAVVKDPDHGQSCKIERDFVNCLNHCPTSELKDLTVTSRTVGVVICNDNYEEYKKYKPCVDAAAHGELANLTFNECTDMGMEPILDIFADPFAPLALRYESDGVIVQHNMTAVCRNYYCHVTQNKDLLQEHCSKGAADLWVTLLKARVKTAMEVYKALKVIKTSLSECDKFLNV